MHIKMNCLKAIIAEKYLPALGTLLESSYRTCPYRAKKSSVPNVDEHTTLHVHSQTLRFKHKGGGNNYCICERKFKDNYSSKRHLSSHEDKVQHCSYCNKSFKH